MGKRKRGCRGKRRRSRGAGSEIRYVSATLNSFKNGNGKRKSKRKRENVQRRLAAERAKTKAEAFEELVADAEEEESEAEKAEEPGDEETFEKEKLTGDSEEGSTEEGGVAEDDIEDTDTSQIPLIDLDSIFARREQYTSGASVDADVSMYANKKVESLFSQADCLKRVCGGKLIAEKCSVTVKKKIEDLRGLAAVRDYVVYFCPEPEVEPKNYYWERVTTTEKLVMYFAELEEDLYRLREAGIQGATTLLDNLDNTGHLVRVMAEFCKSFALDALDCKIDEGPFLTFTNGALRAGSGLLETVKAENYMTLHINERFEVPKGDDFKVVARQIYEVLAILAHEEKQVHAAVDDGLRAFAADLFNVRRDRLLIKVGTGRNGKSFHQMMYEAISPNTMAALLSTEFAKSQGGWIWKTHRKRTVFLDEAGKDTKSSEVILKQLTGKAVHSCGFNGNSGSIKFSGTVVWTMNTRAFEQFNFSEGAMQGRTHIQNFQTFLPNVPGLPTALGPDAARRQWFQKRRCVLIAVALQILNKSLKKSVTLNKELIEGTGNEALVESTYLVSVPCIKSRIASLRKMHQTKHWIVWFLSICTYEKGRRVTYEQLRSLYRSQMNTALKVDAFMTELCCEQTLLCRLVRRDFVSDFRLN